MEIILEKAKDNNLTCKVVSEGKQIYMYSKYYPKKNLLDREIHNTDYVVIGVGLGYEISEILKKTKGRVYVIDYDRSFYEIIKNNDTLNAFLNDDRVTFLFGDEYKAFDFENFYNIYVIEKAVSLKEEFFYKVLEILKEKQIKNTLKIKKSEAAYNQKILIIDMYHGYVAKNCADVFIEIGFDVAFFDYKKVIDEKNPDLIIQTIIQENPDIVFSINYIDIVSQICEKFNLYYISWLTDHPWNELYYRKSKNDKEFVFDFEKKAVEDIKNRGIKNIFYMPLAVDIKKSIKKICKSDFVSDISYVGYLHGCALDCAVQMRDKEIVSEVYKIIRKQNENIGRYVIENLITKELSQHFFSGAREEIKKYKYFTPEMFTAMLIEREFDYIFRINFVQAMEEKFDFKLFGNDRWMGFVKSYQGKKLDYYTEMPEIFNKSKININLTQIQFVTAIPLRVFDVLGSCGFLLTNYNEGLSEYFEDGKDIAVFKSIEEAKELAEFYLKHDELRYKMIESAYNKVKKYHTYENRIEKMLKIVFE